MLYFFIYFFFFTIGFNYNDTNLLSFLLPTSFGLGFGGGGGGGCPVFWVSLKVARHSFPKNLQHSFSITFIWWGFPWAARLQELLNCRHIAHSYFKSLKNKNRVREKFQLLQ